LKNDYIKICKISKYMHGNTKKNMNDMFVLRNSFLSSKWNFYNQSSFTNFRRAWIPYYLRINRIGTILWLRYDHLTFSHLTCTTTFRFNFVLNHSKRHLGRKGMEPWTTKIIQNRTRSLWLHGWTMF
jgi:hypothetical protein